MLALCSWEHIFSFIGEPVSPSNQPEGLSAFSHSTPQARFELWPNAHFTRSAEKRFPTPPGWHAALKKTPMAPYPETLASHKAEKQRLWPKTQTVGKKHKKTKMRKSFQKEKNYANAKTEKFPVFKRYFTIYQTYRHFQLYEKLTKTKIFEKRTAISWS